jgi:hypothetical protein
MEIKEPVVSVSPAEPLARRTHPRFPRDVAITRAAAAVLWAVSYLLALHGQQVRAGASIPVLAGLLLAAYPLIDAAASLPQWRAGPGHAQLRASLVIDALAVAGLLISTLSLHTQSVLITFGAWALASGLLQLTVAWRADRSRPAQLPLIISGAISAIAGIFFAATATQHLAHLPYVAGYAVLGAVFFLLWTFINRHHPQQD